MATQVELYDALKRTLDEPTAKMLAESIPQAQDIATKQDIAQLRGDIKDLESRLMRWMWGFFLPLWLGVYGMILTVLLTR